MIFFVSIMLSMVLFAQLARDAAEDAANESAGGASPSPGPDNPNLVRERACVDTEPCLYVLIVSACVPNRCMALKRCWT